MKKSNKAPSVQPKLNKFKFDFKLKEYFEHIVRKTPGELINLGIEVLSSVSNYIEEPHPVNAVKAGFEVWKTLNSQKIYAEEYFHPHWRQPFSSHFNSFIISAIDQFPFQVIKPADDDCIIKIATVFGEEIGWIAYNGGETSGIHVRSDKFAEGAQAIKKALWQAMNHRMIVMFSRARKTTGRASGEEITFEKDDDLASLDSELADKYTTYLKRCIDKNISRTLLFYGPPGTGKSTMVRNITDKLQLKTLRIRVEDVHEMGNNCIFDAIQIFQPDAVILDDLDRTMSQSHLLETMERFHHHIKIVFATVNDRRMLDEALMRPGRFDEICRIRRLDDNVILNMLGEENKSVFEIVKNWPIAFINEYVVRRKFMSAEEAMSSLEELQRRVERLSEEEDIDDEDREEEPEDSGVDETKDSDDMDIKSILDDEEMMDVVDSKGNTSTQSNAPPVPPGVKKYLKRLKVQLKR